MPGNVRLATAQCRMDALTAGSEIRKLRERSSFAAEAAPTKLISTVGAALAANSQELKRIPWERLQPRISDTDYEFRDCSVASPILKVPL